MLITYFLYFLALVSLVLTDILGTPVIECLPNGIKASLNMSQPFMGRIYLRGHYDENGCFRDFSKSPTTSAEPMFNFEDCHMRRKREVNPTGMLMSAVMVISHHPKLVTFRDSAFEIQCFYRQQRDEESSTVIYDMNVQSESSPQPMHIEPALPQCEYHVEIGNATVDSKNSLVSVGDTITHVWTCGNDAPNDVYCMMVHSCFAQSGGNLSVPVVDNKGCVSDQELLSAVMHSSSLRATATAKAFKFAAQSEIRFACQIHLSLRRQYPGGKCPTPQCSSSISSTLRRQRRSIIKKSVDVESGELTVLENRVEFLKPIESQKCSWVNTPLLVISAVFFAYFILTFCLFLNSQRREAIQFNTRL